MIIQPECAQTPLYIELELEENLIVLFERWIETQFTIGVQSVQAKDITLVKLWLAAHAKAFYHSFTYHLIACASKSYTWLILS